MATASAGAAASAARRLLRCSHRLFPPNQLGPQSREASASKQHITDPSPSPSPLLTSKEVILIRSVSCGTNYELGQSKKRHASRPTLKTSGRWQSMTLCSLSNQASRRSYSTWDDPSQEPHVWTSTSRGPPPVHQLTYFSAYDYQLGAWLEPGMYFRVNGMTYRVPKDRLIRNEDGDIDLLLDNSKTCFQSMLLLAYNNNRRRICIAPSFIEDNMMVSYNSATCALQTVRYYHFGEVIGGKEIIPATSYIAAREAFIKLLKKTEGDGILETLCHSTKDLFDRISELEEVTDPCLVDTLERVITDHPAMLSATGSALLIQGADKLLRREYRFGGKMSKKILADQIIESLPYLGPTNLRDPAEEKYWSHIATDHKLLNCFYQFSGNAKRDLEADIAMVNAIKEYKFEDYRLIRINSGRRLLALNRDAVQHGFDPHVRKALKALKDDGTKMPVWPYTTKETINVLSINWPKFLPRLVRELIHCIWRFNLGQLHCWPRHNICDSLAIKLRCLVSEGAQAKLLKLGYQSLMLRLITKKMKGKGEKRNPRKRNVRDQRETS